MAAMPNAEYFADKAAKCRQLGGEQQLFCHKASFWADEFEVMAGSGADAS
jgi:hypothetical protein